MDASLRTVKKFNIPSKLRKIQKVSNPDERFRMLKILSQDMNISLGGGEENLKETTDETKMIREIRQAHKEFVSSICMAVGLAMILLSGVSAVIRSFF